MWGYVHPREPIGPRPGDHSPEARAMWQAAAEALGYVPGQMREHSDGQLWAWRSQYAREMAWAPEYKGDELALVRGEIRRAQIEADRARRNARAASGEARQRLEDLAAARAAWEQAVRELAGRLAEAQAGYDAWETATAATRERAISADAELRRRHPGMWIELLRPQRAGPGGPPALAGTGQRAAEPGGAAAAAVPRQRGADLHIPVTDAEVAAASAQPREHPAPAPAAAARWRAAQAARIEADRQARAEAAARACPVTDAEIARYGRGRQELQPHPAPQPQPAGTAAGTAKPGRTGPGMAVLSSQAASMDEIRRQVHDISARLDELAMTRARQAREKAAELTSMTIPGEDPDAEPSAAWIDAVQARQRQAVRHEPMPRVPAAEPVQAAAEAGVSDREAAD
jgi:hypothetical protein